MDETRLPKEKVPMIYTPFRVEKNPWGRTSKREPLILPDDSSDESLDVSHQIEGAARQKLMEQPPVKKTVATSESAALKKFNITHTNIEEFDNF
jgi:hypothetical protein